MTPSTHRTRRALAGLAASVALLTSIAATPFAGPDWSTRLAALDPSRPMDYFELGEEVADAATTPEERQLARRLYGLAGTLAPDLLGRSAALAQASLADDDRQRRTLLALASLLDATSGGDLAAAQRPRPAAESAVALSEAFSHLRRGQGPRASSTTKAPPVAALLDLYGTHLPGGPERFREDCRTFKSGLRPSYPMAQLLVMLEVEEAVLSAAVPANEQRTLLWSTALVETDGAPLLEVDVTKLDTALGVDPERPYWRKGQWERSR
ncbi:MAG: hypothetical protein JNL80_09890 [Phycisphaerae bacterium]|nr:hypothetical protein [Phycisphaerae bacterium]